MTRSLDALFDPRSVAVVGASDDPTAWGHWLAVGALAGEHRRPVWLVNQRAAATGGQVLGRQAVATVADLSDVDLVAVAVPGPHVAGVVTAGLARGARAFVVVTADVTPADGATTRADAERELAAAVRAGGARLLGPNCLGVVDTSTDLSLAWGAFDPGPVAVVTQSGQVGLEIAHLLRGSGIGVSRFVSTGACDVGIVDVLHSLVGHRSTRVVAVYAESLGDGRAVVDAAAALHEAGTRVVLLAPGSSPAGARAAASHTAALVSADSVVDALCRAGGIVRVATPAALAAACGALSGAGAPRGRPDDAGGIGRRVGVVSDSGGQGVIAADALVAAGLQVPELTSRTRATLAAALSTPRAVTANPVDLAGAGEQDLSSYRSAVAALAGSGEVDAVLLTGYFGRYGVDSPAVAAAEVAEAEQLAESVRATGTPLVVHAMVDGTAPAVDALRRGRITVIGRIEDAVTGLAALATPAPDPPRRALAVAPMSAAGSAGSGYALARALLADRGVEFPPAVVLPPGPGQVDAAVGAATTLGARVAVKATSLQHKTEHGAVVLDLVGHDEVRRAVVDLRSRLGEVEITVEAMARPEAGVELLVGARRDPIAGPVVTVASGGVTAEVDRDVAVALAPVDTEQALALLDRLRLAPLLSGWRGAPPLDRAAVAACVVAVADASVSFDDIAELEVNPLLVTAGGAVALDAWASVVEVARP